jgi:hypothetical protein
MFAKHELYPLSHPLALILISDLPSVHTPQVATGLLPVIISFNFLDFFWQNSGFHAC